MRIGQWGIFGAVLMGCAASGVVAAQAMRGTCDSAAAGGGLEEALWAKVQTQHEGKQSSQRALGEKSPWNTWLLDRVKLSAEYGNPWIINEDDNGALQFTAKDREFTWKVGYELPLGAVFTPSVPRRDEHLKAVAAVDMARERAAFFDLVYDFRIAREKYYGLRAPDVSVSADPPSQVDIRVAELQMRRLATRIANLSGDLNFSTACL